MRLTACLILVACGGSQPAPTPVQPPPSGGTQPGVSLVAEDATHGGHEAIIRDGAEKVHAALTAAAGRGSYEIHVTLQQLEQGDQLACKIGMGITLMPSREMYAFLNGSAKADGSGDAALAECIDAVIASLLETQAVPAIRARASNVR